MAKRRPRRKRDGSIEWPVDCPTCGSPKMDVNLSKMVYHCWRCGSGGRVPKEWAPEFSLLSSWRESIEALPPAKPIKASNQPLPLMAKREIQRRGFEEAWIVNRYKVWWDGERLVWPAGEYSCSRRAVLPWEEPKAITDAGPEGKELLGQHLLKPGSHVVLTEGDWKSAAIPLPWVGVGLLGVELTELQKEILLLSNPATVIVCLDGGFNYEAMVVRTKLLPTPGKIVDLPDGKGPDDIPRRDLVQLLRGVVDE